MVKVVPIQMNQQKMQFSALTLVMNGSLSSSCHQLRSFMRYVNTKNLYQRYGIEMYTNKSIMRMMIHTKSTMAFKHLLRKLHPKFI